ncbi:hypothetical protein MPSEU_000448700 [Mayamaea pseudoterrestris]|nr:hypothetical protein MPSEU_000448700 [Mayamaea pseudoterrestris]
MVSCEAVSGRRRLLILIALGFHLFVLLLFQSQVMTVDRAALRLVGRNDTNNTNSPELYVYVSGWMEGMSSWMISLSEMVVLSKELNATFVEPCIRKGRLCSCKSKGNTLTRLSHVLDMDKLKKYHSSIITYDEFVERTEPYAGNAKAICMHHFSPKPVCVGAPLMYGRKRIPQVDDAIWSSQLAPTILEIRRYGRYAFQKSEWVSDAEAARVKQQYLRLAPQHFQHVDGLLKSMGIASHEPYSVIHWRAEIPGIDYMNCAKRIIEVRETMKLNHSVILMSSLNTREEYSWDGARNMAKNTSASSALRSLLDAGFLKLDQVVDYDSLADSVMFPVYDLILAMKAREFVTCTKGCEDDSICAVCNWRGQFAGLAVSLRQEVEKRKSVHCWPGGNHSDTL